MTFPAVPRDLATEIFVGGQWVDISTFVRDSKGILIGRGLHNYSGSPDPSSCGLSLLNPVGDFSPRCPTGQYYGDFNRNTPLRVAINRGVDQFTRTVSNGWGSSPAFGAWTTVLGSGGVVQASDYQVAGNVGTMSVPVANGYRIATLAGASYRDVDYTAQATVPFTDVTGAAIYPLCLVVRAASATDFVYAAVKVATDETVTLAIYHFDGTVIAAEVTIGGLTHASATALKCRVVAEGHTYRAKVWQGTAEPYAWQVAGHFTRNAAAGYLGLMGLVGLGNTNAKPIVFSYDNLAWRQPRFQGEISAIKPGWDASQRLVWSDIEAAGIKRRLGSKTSPLLSPGRRRISYITKAGNVVGADVIAWWPLEDPEDTAIPESVAVASAGSYVYPSVAIPYGASGAGRVVLNGTNDCPGAPRSMVVNPQGDIYLQTGNDRAIALLSTSWGAMFGLKVEPTKTAAVNLDCNPNSATVGTSGWRFRMVFLSTGSVEIRFDDTGAGVTDVLVGTLVVRSNGWLNHDWNHYVISARQNGANVDWTVWFNGEQTLTGTRATTTLRPLTEVRFSGTHFAGADAGPFAVAHANILKSYPALWNASTVDAISDAVIGHRGEYALDRMSRILAENGMNFSYIGNTTDTPKMGPQPTDTLLGILEQCAAADGGTLFEPRGDIGFAYRTHASRYNQTSAFTLNYAGGHVDQPFDSIDDDQVTVNDVRVSRIGGATARNTVTTGRLGTADPPTGVGIYEGAPDLSLYSDDQLEQIAAWLTFVGTLDASRYDVISINLANSDVVAAGIDEAVLRSDIDDRFSITNPFVLHDPDQIDLLARGYFEQINVLGHKVQINCTPGAVYDALQPGLAGKSYIDSENSTLNGAHNSSTTSLSVASTNGMLWVVGAGLSIPVKIAGELVTVTTIAGAASPQTFTVTRSQNGVVKSLPSGSAVRTARRTTIGR